MKVAIHQPNFFPYLGYFDKASKVDIFVFMDDFQFTKGSFINRNKIKKPNGTMWLTVPVKHENNIPINEKEIANEKNWKDSHLNTLKHMYGKARHYNEMENFFNDVYSRDWHLLIDLNLFTLNKVFEYLSIEAKTKLTSKMEVISEDTSQRILEICKEVGATEYLSGISGKHYLNTDIFSTEGIKVSFHEFEHPHYRQRFGEFIPNLSVIDYLMNVGSQPID